MNHHSPGTHADTFRPVPRTGVIYVMAEAGLRGFKYGHPDWANLGQGAPETGALAGAPPRVGHIALNDEIHEYGPVMGMRDLREAVAALYNQRYRRGMPSQYAAENVCISAGGRAGLTRLAASIGSIHLGHLLPDYTAYAELLNTFHAFLPIPITLRAQDGFILRPARLREEIVAKGLGAVLASNPCNPTGQLVHGADLEGWVRTCREMGCALILDEFYNHYLYDEALADGPALSAARYVEDVERDPVILVDGLTKNWRYPGWRVSWTVGPRHVIDRLASAGSFLDGGPPHPVQSAALPLIDADVADQEARAIQAVFSAKRALMVRRAREMGLLVPHPPLGAFYCFVSLENLPEHLRNGMDFFRAALDKQVIVVPGVFFDVDPGQRRQHIPSRLRHWVRLSFGPDMAQLNQGLDGLEAMIRGA